jgi:mRNA-degrading endonuclease RelE of RelBE toxin-antitoxin system
MAWTVMLTSKAAKQYKKLPKPARDNIDTLVTEIRWPDRCAATGQINQSCRIRNIIAISKKANHTYVAVWREDKGQIRLVEVIYAGTHEKAPY